MSGVAAVFGASLVAGGRQNVNGMIAANRRGAAERHVVELAEGTLGVGRTLWETDAAFSGPHGCVSEGDLVVAADATLYYHADLRRGLRDANVIPLAEGSPSHHLLEAYRAWAENAPAKLEGDFAFILWDRSRRQLVAARSFSGKRPLYFWEGSSGGSAGIMLASTVGGLRACEHVQAPMDMDAVGRQAAGLSIDESETPYKGVRAVPPGFTLVWSPGSSARLVRHWTVSRDDRVARLRFDDAAAELKRLLQRAVAERLAPSGPTAVWMSGGRDSTAVFAAGHQYLRNSTTGGGRAAKRILPVSLSYPQGDEGHEDELIAAAAAHWGEKPVWLNPYSAPVLSLVPQKNEEGVDRDEPFTHPFEHWNRALARGARDIAGSRIALDGNGGDQLFGGSPYLLSDLFYTGRWPSLAQQWQQINRSGGNPGARAFLNAIVRPGIPRWMLTPLRMWRDEPVGYLAQRHVPSWIETRFVDTHDIVSRERDREWAEQYAGPGKFARASLEFFFGRSGEVSRYHNLLSSFALSEGVELRSPLSDGRLVAFACSRPASDRLDGRDTKRLLRAALKGMLPDEILATRPFRTGTTRQYFVKSLAAQVPSVLRALSGGRMALQEAGIVNAAQFLEQWNLFLKKGEHPSVVQLYRTLQAELWLRNKLGYPLPIAMTHSRPAAAPDGAAQVAAATGAAAFVAPRGRFPLPSSQTLSLGTNKWYPANSHSKGATGIQTS